jgi:FkbH-like protein
MTLLEALNILREGSPAGAEPFEVALACGFTPLHLQTFLAARLSRLRPDRRVVPKVGVYGDCLGNLGRLAAGRPAATAVVLEWPDLDPRLGLRHLGGWGPGAQGDILATVGDRLPRYHEALAAAAEAGPVALCLPTLPLPPIAHVPGRQAGGFELDLRERIARFAAAAARLRGVRVVGAARLDVESPPSARWDVKSELGAGFPYSLPHASAVAALLAELLAPPAPKKGLITDLDDTLWRGILGDAGVRGVSWDLDNHSQVHGLYQQTLAALAEAGVLVAVASKNDPAPVDEALGRADLILPRDCLFPVDVHWGPKSESVGRILRAWNIGASDVVFVDDSPIELAEVRAAYPQIEGLLFPARDERAALALLTRLRDLFGKETISREDALRRESLRRSASWREEAASGGASGPSDDFLAGLEAELTLDFARDADDARALELINKTNQFNLNGRRIAEGDWRAALADPATFLLRASYRDKFGPLGTIAVVAGRADGEAPRVDAWVMSCRAFSRRIEHRCLERLFEHLGAERIAFDFQETSRNGPLVDFFRELLGEPPAPGFSLSRAAFAERCPPLHHRTVSPTHG